MSGRGCGRGSTCRRIIPALAGNTSHGEHLMAGIRHPRVDGEHAFAVSLGLEPVQASPPGRGTPCGRRRRSCRRRVIPAWAGNTFIAVLWLQYACPPSARSKPPEMPFHSLGNWTCFRGRVSATGSSPHWRGTLERARQQHVRQRVIPAWAGNTGSATATGWGWPGHPRVGGEHPSLQNQQSAIYGYPRVGGEHAY